MLILTIALLGMAAGLESATPEEAADRTMRGCSSEDVTLSDQQEHSIQQIVSQSGRQAVLFVGGSDAGKTKAAASIAAAKGFEIYRIDSARVVSKYIGETEKNLARIFDRAEEVGAILFFDEADALFGKRSGVKDAHDRYANIEVGYLLQRLEAYPGIIILASNSTQPFDAAILRRFNQIVEFTAERCAN